MNYYFGRTVFLFLIFALANPSSADYIKHKLPKGVWISVGAQEFREDDYLIPDGRNERAYIIKRMTGDVYRALIAHTKLPCELEVGNEVKLQFIRNWQAFERKRLDKHASFSSVRKKEIDIRTTRLAKLTLDNPKIDQFVEKYIKDTLTYECVYEQHGRGKIGGLGRIGADWLVHAVKDPYSMGQGTSVEYSLPVDLVAPFPSDAAGIFIEESENLSVLKFRNKKIRKVFFRATIGYMSAVKSQKYIDCMNKRILYATSVEEFANACNYTAY